jgi:hypothetical protein
LAQLTKDNGALNLPTEQFQRLMNIVHVESVILGLNKVKNTYKGTELFYKYDKLLFKENMKLSDLTGNLEPNDLLKEMYLIDN